MPYVRRNARASSLSSVAQRMFHLFGLVMCVRQCVVLCELIRGDPPGCHFPDFLQSTEPGMGDWTWKYDGDTHVGKVHGGMYTICSNQYPRDGRGIEDSCLESQQKRKCVRQYGPNLFAVQHDEYRPTYQCIRFIIRSPTVVQLAVSDRWVTIDGICNQNMTLDHSPWISAEHYKTAIVNCPFTGGYNFQQVREYTRDHVERRLCRHMTSRDRAAPVRVESDCIEKEGVNLHFRERSCIPNKSYFGKSQKLVCMAAWEVDGDGFVLLRKEHERAFYCMRVIFKNLEVTELVVYLDWECYRGTDLSGPGGKLSYSTSYVIFRKAEKRIISVPCSDELSTCSSSDEPDCRDKQCMHTCKECLNSTGFPCQFDDDVIGNWVIREPYHTHLKLHIHKNALHHSRLGILSCLTFNPQSAMALRAMLWGTYQNGCYPRFMCMYYDTPTTSIMRYRLSNVQRWPLELSDSAICHEDNFLVPPNYDDPRDRYEERPWEIAVKSVQVIHRMPCIYPIELPDTASFVDNHNRSGCITLRSRSSPKTISVTYVQRSLNPHTKQHRYLNHQQHRYQCIAALTYINSYKTVITLTEEREHETLCWMVVDSRTLVVVNTSSCNKQTALGILRKEEKYLLHLKGHFVLGAAGEEVDEFCRGISENNEKDWLARLEEQVEVEDYTYGDSGSKLCCSFYIVSLLTLLHVIYLDR